MKLNCYRPRVLQMDQARSPLGTQHHQPPPPPSLESENETVDVESVSADVSSVSVDQSPLPMALPSHLDIEDDKQMDSTVLRQIMNIVVSLQPNQGAFVAFITTSLQRYRANLIITRVFTARCRSQAATM